MAKQLNFEYQGKEYILEFTRATVKEMEREGFKSADVINKPMLTLPKLFAGAFKAHHRYTKAKIIEEMFDKFTNKNVLIDKLAEMYVEPIETLMEEPEDEGNAIAWEPNF